MTTDSDLGLSAIVHDWLLADAAVAARVETRVYDAIAPSEPGGDYLVYTVSGWTDDPNGRDVTARVDVEFFDTAVRRGTGVIRAALGEVRAALTNRSVNIAGWAGVIRASGFDVPEGATPGSFYGRAGFRVDLRTRA